ncbi:MAG: transglycosylase SLT domain-containing protein, partial [Selenomonadaceae bacterium]|nr:transglycosylase SLT domain-containing protein [Selenomonadaceae bacterium]
MNSFANLYGNNFGSRQTPIRRRNFADLYDFTPQKEKKKPEEQGTLGFIADNLAAGAGRSIQTWGQILEEGLRPENMTPSEWKEHQSPLFKSIQDTGREMYERNARQYEDNSFGYHAANILQSAPESLGIMAASILAGLPLGGALGAAGGAGRAVLSLLPRYGDMAWKAAKAYQNSKVLKTLVPASTTSFAAQEAGAGLEALSESQNAKNEYIDKAKANGTYVKDKTELEANEIGDRVFWDNVGIISAFNTPQYNMLYGKPAKGLLGNLGRLAVASGSEGAEEVAQEVASAHELGENIDPQRLRDAAIAGTTMGAMFHGAGRAGQYIANRNQPFEEERKAPYIERSQKFADLYQNARSEEAARQAYRDAEEQLANEQFQLKNLRNWTNTISDGVMSDDVFNSIIRNAQNLGYTPEETKLALALATAESNGNQDVQSEVGAIGVMQLMPETAESLGVDPYDQEQNILGGLKYLKQQLNTFNGDWNLAAAAYNAGDGAVKRYGGIPPYSETQGYVSRINEFLGQAPDYQGDEEPKVDFAAGLQSARKSLDGKQMDNGTVGCVEAVTKILSHVHPEFKKMVDDGVVNTVEGENSLHSRLEKMGVEIIPFDESKISQGDIIFYDGKQTYQHVLVADHKDADGNWRVFGNSSSANKVMEQPLYQGQTPAWIAKVSTLQGNATQSRAEQLFTERIRETMRPENVQKELSETDEDSTAKSQNHQEESSKPLFDLNAQDSTTQKLLEQFANERFAKAVDDKDVPTVKFFNGMFDDNSAFQDTQKNREAIVERYGGELNEFIQNNQSVQTQTQAQVQTQPAGNKPSRPEIKSAANRFLEVLRANNSPANAKTALTLNNALKNNNFVEVENILNQNGVAISAPRQNQSQQTQSSPPQVEPVSNNTPPQNILAQPAKTSGNEKLIKQASKLLNSKTSRAQKEKIGNAIIRLANQNGIAVPSVDFKSLQNGSSKKIQEWQAKLSEAGAFTISSTQEQSAQPAQEKPLSLKERANQIEINAAREQWEGIKQGYKNIQTARKISAGLYGDLQGTANEQGNIETPDITQDYIDTPIIAQEDIRHAKDIRHQSDSDKAVASRPSLKNFGMRAEIARDLRDSYVADTSKAKIFDDIPAWRGRTREDNLALRKDFRNEISRSKEARASERIKNLNTEEEGQAVRQNAIENYIEDVHVQTPQEIQAAQEREREVQEQQRINRQLYSDIDLGEWQENNFSAQKNTDTNNYDDDPESFIAPISKRDIQQAKMIQNQSRKESPQTQPQPQAQSPVQPKPETQPQIQSQQEVQPQSKKQSKGKWYTVGSAGSREDLQKLIREKFYNKNLTIEDDGTVRDPQSGKHLSYVVRNNKGRWQLGEYENVTDKSTQTQPQETSLPKSDTRRGNTAEVITGSRKAHQIQYRVVEANELNSSHTIDNSGVFANENYPAELQPRDRTRADMQAQLTSMSNNLNPADLMEARDVNQGAPVIRNDGVVLNGNGRTAAIRSAYENGKGNAYKSALIEQAQKFGLNADEISKMNQPVLVRELKNNLSAEELQDITTTQTGGARMGSSEQAQSDAAKISADTLALYPQDENADITHAAANDFLSAAINDIATPDERNALTQRDGRINQDGINRVKRALFALAYGDEGLISRMSESTDDNVRGATNALLNAAPAIAQIQAGMQNGTLHKYNLKAISDAVKKLSALRDEGKTVQNYLQEQTLFAEHADSEEMKEILSFLDKSKRAPKKITSFIKNITQGIKRQGDPRQGNLFGLSEEPAPLIDLIKSAREETENAGNVPMFSKQGEVDTRIDNIVEDKNFTPQQKLLKSFGKKLGVKTVFFINKDGDFHGAHAGNTSYINVNSKMPHGKVFWHESSHWLKNNNSALFDEFAKAAGITDAQRKAYLERTGRTDLTTDEAIDEEIIADQFEDVAKRTGLMQSISGKNRGLIERVVQWLKDTMNKFVDHFRNPQGKLKTVQAQALADEFGKIANQLVDANGNKIFRYNRRTKNIELADGRSLATKKDVNDGELELPQGYRTESGRPLNQSDAREFIIKPDGSRDFGKIDKEIVIAANELLKKNQSEFRFKIAPVRLLVGTEDIGGVDGFGYKHILEHLQSIKDRGFENIPQYVEHVLKNFNQVYKADKEENRIILYCKGDTSKGFMPLDLEFEKREDNFYNIITAYPRRRANKRETLLIDTRPTNASTVAATVPHLQDSNNQNGVASQRDIVVSNVSKENISQSEGEIKYSIGNDNSAESLKQKIKNKISSLFDGKESSIRREKKITENLRALSGHRILYGNVKGADDVVVNHMQKLIQIRHAYNWEKLLPVVGAEIAKQLKINPTSAQSNYIADWLLTGALNNTSAEAKEFQKSMRANPAMAELLQATRDLFQEITDMTPIERIQSKIVERQNKSLWERLGVFKGGFSEEFLDDLSPLQDLVERAIKNSPPEVAAELKRGVDVKKLAQLSRGRGA